nr:UDP-N-acetylglucosamine 2-epimerase (non-hydrolyzing) [uncultured Desulfobacter sp.]
MKTIMTILGARPQFIKAAMVSRIINDNSELREILVHTGQHFDSNMSDVFFSELEIPKPTHHLGISGGSHGAMTGRMIEQLEAVMQKEAPDWVMIYGDTNSTLAGALAAAKLDIPVAHVEAGLRSWNRRMPEEINRVLTDHIATLLFTPTDTATKNLLQEGISGEKIFQVGDVMYDAALYYGERSEKQSRLLTDLSLERGRYILATIHRQENTDDPDRLKNIFLELQKVAYSIPVVLPLHPRTRKYLEAAEFNKLTTGLVLLSPLSYLDMALMERCAAVIVTDSGGVQKEAYFHGVPCVTLRDETEWIELIELSWNRLVPPNSGEIAEKILATIGTQGENARIYGNGDAAKMIVEQFCEKR